MTDAASILALLDKHAPAPNTAGKIGLSPQRVRALLGPVEAIIEQPLSAEAARLAIARAWPKLAHGSGKIPPYVIAAMAADYARLGSLEKTGALYGRDASTMQFIFRSHGVPMRKRGGANRCLPSGLAAAMAADYARLGSLRKVGDLYQRHASTVRLILMRRGVIMKDVGCPIKARA
jgi:hypothetical protein